MDDNAKTKALLAYASMILPGVWVRSDPGGGKFYYAIVDLPNGDRFMVPGATELEAAFNMVAELRKKFPERLPFNLEGEASIGLAIYADMTDEITDKLIARIQVLQARPVIA